MIVCESCQRHHRTTEEQCPFCARPRSKGTVVMNAVGAAIASFVLAACYGGITDDTKYPTGATGDTGTPTTPATGGTGATTTTGGTGATTVGGTGATTTSGSGAIPTP